MGHKTFDYVCRIANDFIAKEELNMQETIHVPKIVGIVIKWLANDGSYRSVRPVRLTFWVLKCRFFIFGTIFIKKTSKTKLVDNCAILMLLIHD